MNKIQIGERAKQITEDRVYQLAMNKFKEKIFNGFRGVNLGDTDRLTDMHMLMRAADLFHNEFEIMINDAAVEAVKNEQGNIKKIKR